MGKKVKKKTRSGHKEKQVSYASPRTVTQQSIAKTETVDIVVSVLKERKACPHIDKGIYLDKVLLKLGSSEPLRCEDCREGVVDRRASKGRSKHGKKKGGGSANLKSESKATWVCLECGHFSCGGVGLPMTPQSHAVRHAKHCRHPLAIQFENPHLRWCFSCNTLIPVEKSEEIDEQKDALQEIVKVIKGRPPDGASVNVEDVWFGSGSVNVEIKSENIVSSILDGRGGYVVRGLANLGNTCFFNSVMQNLLAMNKLQDHFFKLDGSVGPLTAALKKLFTETILEGGLRHVINPRSLFGSLCAKAPQFRGYQQHDSHELLRCFLDGLCTEELSARKQAKAHEENGSSSNSTPTLVDAIFGGQLSSTVACLECGHSSRVYEPFLDLSLPVPTKKPLSKKGQKMSRAKKPKQPPKRVGRMRSKVNIVGDFISAQSYSNPSTDSKLSCQVKSSEPAAVKMDPSSADDNVLASQDIPTKPESETQQSFLDCMVNTEESYNETWMDYLGIGTVSSGDDIPLQLGNFSAVQDNGNRDVVESTHHVHSVCAGEVVPCKLLDEDAITLGNAVVSVPDDIQNGIILKHNSESDSLVCPLESNAKGDSLGKCWEDETTPLLVEDSQVLFLPYREDTSSAGEILREEGELSSSAVGFEQDVLDSGGFGDLFNEPAVASGPMKPSPSFINSEANEVAETGFMAGNDSDSDPGVIDNSDSPLSVETCLAYFTKPELLSREEHAWQCENCSKALQEQKKILRNRLQNPPSKVIINGSGNKISNDPLVLGKGCSFHNEFRNHANGKPTTGLVISSDEILPSDHEDTDYKQKCILGASQEEQLNKVASLLEGSSEMNGALSKLPESSSLYKTCSQISFSCQTSEFFSINEPSNCGCDTDEVLQMESQLLDGKLDSEGSEVEEQDSHSVKVKRDATKVILINRAPAILTIHLKRFSQDARGRLSKLNGHVDFRDIIDLRPFMDPRCIEREKYEYCLIGVVEHLGTMRGGHYVAYIKSGVKKENGEPVWYHASDAYVQEVSWEEVLRCEAYILFYEEL